MAKVSLNINCLRDRGTWYDSALPEDHGCVRWGVPGTALVVLFSQLPPPWPAAAVPGQSLVQAVQYLFVRSNLNVSPLWVLICEAAGASLLLKGQVDKRPLPPRPPHTPFVKKAGISSVQGGVNLSGSFYIRVWIQT